MHPTVITPSCFSEGSDRLPVASHPLGPVLLWACDAEGSFEFFSPSWLAFTGRSLADELGQGWLERVIPEERDLLWNDMILALQERRPWQRGFRIAHHDGTYRWMTMEGTMRHDRDGRLAGFIGYCQELAPRDGDDMVLDQVTSLLRQTQLLALMIDARGRISFANERLGSLLGHAETSLCQTSFFDHFCSDHPDLQPDRLCAQDPYFPASFETQTVGASQHLILWHAMVQRDYAGRLDGVVLLGEDVTVRRREENQLFLTSKVFESSQLAMAIVNLQGNIVSVNNAFTQLTGYSPEEALGQNPRILQSGRHGPAFYREMWASINANGHWHGDIWDRRKDGTIYPKFLSINVMRDDKGALTHYSSIFTDITERKNIEEKLNHLAHHDTLTGLPNRLLLERRLGQSLCDVAGGTDQIALFYIDLDRFKQVNDSLGHQAGDRVLVEVTTRLKGCIRASDTVARVGGDEFIVLLPHVRNQAAIERIASEIVDVLKQPIALGEQEVVCTPSIGISVYPDHGADGDRLIHHADQAMYRIKTTTRCGYHVFTPLS